MLKELLLNTNWEKNIEVQMERPPDYRFMNPSLFFSFWITPNRKQIETIIEGESVYIKFSEEDSKTLFYLMTGEKLE
ncbi:hypothetical protein [Bacillus pinisoli]|uniref:hypothetical protein n=1 Tax=Bacillus pinisoli TaxID=2901866 RepID=UPI001FF66B05|nr:hypothetical protein [Bacillus pinisoli]